MGGGVSWVNECEYARSLSDPPIRLAVPGHLGQRRSRFVRAQARALARVAACRQGLKDSHTRQPALVALPSATVRSCMLGPGRSWQLQLRDECSPCITRSKDDRKLSRDASDAALLAFPTSFSPEPAAGRDGMRTVWGRQACGVPGEILAGVILAPVAERFRALVLVAGRVVIRRRSGGCRTERHRQKHVEEWATWKNRLRPI